MGTTFKPTDYKSKHNYSEREPTQEDIAGLQYPKDRFDLLSVDRVYEWDQKHGHSLYKDKGARYKRMKSVWITVRCKRCGTVKQVADNPRMGCKQGPCHQKFVDMTGKKVHHLTPVEYVKTSFRKGAKPKWYWRCKCDCGRMTLATENELHYGAKQACEICGRKIAVEKTKLPNNGAAWHRWYRMLKKNALYRGYAMELDYDTCYEMCSKGQCHYCGRPPQLTSYGVYAFGIDRVDNTKGYIKGNVVPCCGRCNVMKRDDTEQEFLDNILRIARHRGLTLNDYPVKEYTEAGGNGEHQHTDVDSPLFDEDIV